MHIPDNYLSPSTCAVFGAAMIPVWKRAASKVKEEVSKKKIPLLGIGAAFSFLIMMFNLPLPGGTTGHAVGATLIAILLGPYSACIAVTIALVVQALFFGDGGILAIGANCFNMAFVMPFVGYYTYKFIKGKSKEESRDYIAAFIAGYIALNVAAFCTSIMFGIQPVLFKDSAGMPMYAPYPLKIAIPAMLIPHMLVAGFVEAFATAGVYGYIKKVSPDIIYKETKVKSKGSAKAIYGLIIAMIVLSPIGLLAPGTAWGEWGADEIKEIVGFVPKAMGHGFNFEAMMPDYSVPGISEVIGYVISAMVGVALILGIIKLITANIKVNNEVEKKSI